MPSSGIQSDCKITRRRTLALLAGVVILLLLFPVLELVLPDLDDAVYDLLFTGLFLVLMFTAVLFLSQSRKALITAALLATPPTVMILVRQFDEGIASEIIFDLTAAVFIFYLAGVAVKAVYNDPRVSIETILAALCIYLLIGVAWSLLYSMIEAARPNSFSILGGVQSSELMRVGVEGSRQPNYFSFVTMSTLGYGDIVPVSPAARMLSAFQAIVGQFYLAVLVARLVGLHIAGLAGRQVETSEA